MMAARFNVKMIGLRPALTIKPYLLVALIVVAVALTLILLYSSAFNPRIIVATTTSLYDTGLLDYLGEYFKRRYDVNVYFIPLGTGLALQYGKRGDVDVVLVHDPPKELSFMREGFGVNRRIVAYNFFVLVGPPEDPAQIEGLPPLDALRRIVEAGRSGKALWVSRGDESGTHSKEKELWRSLGLDPSSIVNEYWYVEAGADMGKTLLIANEKKAYTLADASTYLRYFEEGRIRLKDLVGKGVELLNVYSVIIVNPRKVGGVNFKGAMAFAEFLTSEEGQSLIESYGKQRYECSMFYPAVELLKGTSELANWIREYAFLEGYECPPQYQLLNHS
ncbi:MAG: substrate-binding domain-containing protein [Candidatus Nezhaarchaeales archaeon]